MAATRTTLRASCTLSGRTTNRPCPRSGAAASARIGCGTSFRSSRDWEQLDLQRYAIKSVAEAEAYLAHPILGPRLVECAEAALRIDGLSANDDLRLPRRHEAAILRHLVRRRIARGFGVPPVDRQVLSRHARRQDAGIDPHVETLTRVITLRALEQGVEDTVG